MTKTLVIIPCYNESENIIKLIDALYEHNDGIDILVVDDSSDNTSDLVRERMQSESRLHLIQRETKSGRGTAVLEGFKFALEREYKLIAEMDADFSHDPKELSLLLEVSGDNTLVIGSRYIKGSKIVGWPLTRKVFSKLANIYARIILGIPIKDYTDGYRIYGRSALEKLDLNKIEGSGYIVLSEISYQMYIQGVDFKEVPILFVNRSRGASNFSLKEVMEAFTSVVRIKRRNTKR